MDLRGFQVTAEELEQAIEREYQAILSTKNEDDERAAFHRMTTLIRQRTPERIAQMEVERGLR